MSGSFGGVLRDEAPVVLCDCISFLRTHGLYETGIFRVPGNGARVESMAKSYTSASKRRESVINLFQDKPEFSVHDVCSLFKLYLKSLEQPLIPEDSGKEMMEVVLNDQVEDEVQELSNIMENMVSPNRECLGFVVSFLREICTFQKFSQRDRSSNFIIDYLFNSYLLF